MKVLTATTSDNPLASELFVKKNVKRELYGHFCYNFSTPLSQGWSKDVAVVRASPPLLPMWSGLKSRQRRHIQVEFVVGSLLCFERFFSEYAGFRLSSKINISKFRFDQKWKTSNPYVDVPPLKNRYFIYIIHLIMKMIIVMITVDSMKTYLFKL